MSFGFRDRVKRDKPRLSDRFRGKSGDEIVEELRKDFAKRKQMFFDTAPRTADFMKPGFPFDDTSRWRNRGDSDLKHRLDDIAQRYPEFADQLRGWTDGESPSGMGWGSKQAPAQPQTPLTQPAAQAAQQQQQPQQQQQQQPTGAEADARTTRAMSAPPDNRAKDPPQRFVSRLEINPNTSSGEGAQQQQQQTPPVNQQPSQPQPSQPQPQQSAQAEPKKKPSNVRHIPIFVEGRNETVMPRDDVDSATADFGKAFGSPPRERDSRDREDGFHGPAYAKYAPPGFGFRNNPWPSYQRTSSPFRTRDPMHGSPPQQQHFPQTHHPQYQQPHHSQQQSHPQPQPQAQPQPQPQPQPQQQQQPPQQHPEPAREQTPPRQPPPKFEPKDPLEEVAAVQKDVDELMKQVEAFTGSRQDKYYIYLDEMLTRNLLKLDLVETEGKENVRAARKETIRCIQKGISLLESKAMTPEEIAARDKAMEVDPEPEQVEPMEVTSGQEQITPTEQAVSQTPAPADSPAPSPAPASSATPTPSEPSSSPAPTPAAAPSETPSEAMAEVPADTSTTAPTIEPKPSQDSNTSTVSPEASSPTPETTSTSTPVPPVNTPATDAVAPTKAAAPAAAS